MASTIGARTPDESPGSTAADPIASSEFFFKPISNIRRFEAVSCGIPSLLSRHVSPMKGTDARRKTSDNCKALMCLTSSAYLRALKKEFLREGLQ
ncbi:hypothetical protein [Bradyrhizobium sp. Leo121]|uniref:hypothetical protein n=1 Tax=Bradyrhizobium sp. Leo121 TaxID=1571195 RepID=UPI0013EF49CC|nr:hypothetical protein [Bradyrhizobium sp. Leo121]